ncbi:MAG: DNA gyrase/topoisomerase IV subunit A, partial [Bacteroidota bacterium]|nr:DNA gyrase/topoisomerase IV subunit A [Bacteroidota bacterium]
VKHHLEHLTEFAIAYFKRLKKEYGAGRERKTEIKLFDDIEASKVVIRNTKLYVNRKEGFVGTSLKKDEYVTDCADIDDIIVFTKEGKMMVSKVDTKTFVGKDIIHVAVFKKKDKRTIYNMLYRDGKGGATYVKRFNVTSTTRDREYDMTKGKKGSQVLYFSANPNGEAEVVSVYLRAVGNIKKLKFDLDFSDILIKGRNANGNLATKHAVRTVELKEKGVSTLKPRKIWFDDTIQRLNVDGRGELLGEFKGEDRLLIITQDGIAKTITPELTTRFDDKMIVLEKWIPAKPISAIYWDGNRERYYVKRFLIDNPEKEESFVSDHENTQLELVSTDYRPVVEMVFYKERNKDQKANETVDIEDFISIKGINALGNQFYTEKLKQINLLDPLPYEEPVEAQHEQDAETPS